MNEDWIYKLPKVELHCHLDGSLSIKTIRELAGMSGIEVPPTDGELKKCLQVTEDCGSLFEYLQKFELPIACLQTKETIEYAAYSLMKDAAEENVIYMEVRFAPRVCTAKGLTCKDAVESLWKGLEKAEQEFGILGKIIVCGMRHE
ncbi:MAG: adenosine deaminase, partial [Acetivibrio sp.]